MDEVDQRVLEFMEMLKSVRAIEFDSDFCAAIGMLKQNLGKVKRKESHFRIEHIHMIRKVYNGNPNWFFGVENNMILVAKAK
ncbi:hypothetical protein [Flavobacterium sp. 25HG05S-40]|uniref:hypothetical protein n=1 Tax=Flavobacterium sp. 25HG05S-40 TaxID=3458682 RepID=UPI0040448895